MTNLNFMIRAASWQDDLEKLRKIRDEVFVVEQQVPLELEWDEIDPECDHVLAVDKAGTPIGTGRLLPDGHIGRMAVLKSWRKQGVGSALLTALLDLARSKNMREAVLNAQVSAQPFYEAHGFVANGPVFDEAGIPHIEMRMSLR